MSNSETDKELKRIQKSYNELGAGNVLKKNKMLTGGQQESAAAGEDTLKHAEDALDYKPMAWGEHEEEDVKERPGELEWAEDVKEKKWAETHLEDEEDKEGMDDGLETAVSDVGRCEKKSGEKERKDQKRGE